MEFRIQLAMASHSATYYCNSLDMPQLPITQLPICATADWIIAYPNLPMPTLHITFAIDDSPHQNVSASSVSRFSPMVNMEASEKRPNHRR